jgi:hypothetical protein
MNPDELDRALHRAGDRWRAGQPAPPEVNLARLTDARRTWAAELVGAACGRRGVAAVPRW